MRRIGYKMKLLTRAIIKFTVGLVLVAALLFIPAGSFKYANAWIFMGLLFVPMLILGIVLHELAHILYTDFDLCVKEEKQIRTVTSMTDSELHHWSACVPFQQVQFPSSIKHSDIGF